MRASWRALRAWNKQVYEVMKAPRLLHRRRVRKAEHSPSRPFGLPPKGSNELRVYARLDPDLAATADILTATPSGRPWPSAVVVPSSQLDECK